MKSRAENVDADLEKLKAAFSEISRIGAKLSVEISSGEKKQPQRATTAQSSLPAPPNDALSRRQSNHD